MQSFQHIPGDIVITVQKCDVSAGSMVQSRVSCSGGAPVVRMNHNDPVILIRIGVTDHAGSVRGAIINQNQFKITKCLT